MELNKRYKRQKEAKLHEILKLLEEKETELKRRPGKKKLLEQIKRLQNQYDSIISDELFWQFKRNNQRYFEGANKPSKYLASKIKSQEKKFISGRGESGK